MAKIKSKFVCQECGYETAKWLGKCPSCSEWNTFVEEFETKSGDTKSQRGIGKGKVEKIQNITSSKKKEFQQAALKWTGSWGEGLSKALSYLWEEIPA